MKSEIPNPKSQTNPKPEIQNADLGLSVLDLGIGVLGLFGISDLGFEV
jgi:hypothetical protein